MNKHLHIFLLTLLLYTSTLLSQITLTHNVGNTIVGNSMYSCSWGGVCWARKFDLADFGIAADQSFTITSGEVALFYGVNWDTRLQFNIYAVDANFPSSFTEASLIGSSQVMEIPWIDSSGQIIPFSFSNSVTVPAGTATILVEVAQLHSTNSESHAFVAGTAADTDFSWFRSRNAGCQPSNYTTTVALGRPDARFYINVSGTTSRLGTPSFIAKDIAVYPNPIHDVFYIQNIDDTVSVSLFNTLGQAIPFEKIITSSNEVGIKLNGISRGIYYLKVGDATRKIIAQ